VVDEALSLDGRKWESQKFERGLAGFIAGAAERAPRRPMSCVCLACTPRACGRPRDPQTGDAFKCHGLAVAEVLAFCGVHGSKPTRKTRITLRGLSRFAVERGRDDTLSHNNQQEPKQGNQEAGVAHRSGRTESTGDGADYTFCII
jgi:hypothetical protein